VICEEKGWGGNVVSPTYVTRFTRKALYLKKRGGGGEGEQLLFALRVNQRRLHTKILAFFSQLLTGVDVSLLCIA
jgi:hypothetical protein